MKIHISPTLRDAIRTVLEDVETNGGILDAYRAATEIQAAHPDENIALEDIVEAMLRGKGGIQAIEFSPPPMVLEIVLGISEEEVEAHHLPAGE